MDRTPNLHQYLRPDTYPRLPAWISWLMLLALLVFTTTPLCMFIREQTSQGKQLKPATGFLIPFGIGVAIFTVAFAAGNKSGISQMPARGSRPVHLRTIKENIENQLCERLLNLLARTMGVERSTSDNFKKNQEDLALYLANPHEFDRSLFSRTPNLIFVVAFLCVQWSISFFAYLLDSIGFWDMPVGLIVFMFVCMTVPCGYFIFCYAWIGATSGWHWRMGGLARKIRREYLSCDLEKETDCSERLVELIEDLLKGENDSEKRVEERKESIKISVRESRF